MLAAGEDRRGTPMKTRTCLAVLALAAACAPLPPPRVYMPPAGAVPSGPFGGGSLAPRATAMGGLRLCDGASAANVGPVSWDRMAVAFTPHIQTAAGALLRNPTSGACLSSGFGPRRTASGGGREHLGVDLANAGGGYIRAAGPGRVTAAGWRGTYGLFVEIDHGRGVRTRYGHLNEIDPTLGVGSRVAGGAAIGRMGATGNATGVHLHYEVLIRGRHVDPLSYGS